MLRSFGNIYNRT